jgi:signal transduction histidine kinase
MNINLNNSLRFRLTIFYSFLTLVISVIIILGFNIFLTNYFEEEGNRVKQNMLTNQGLPTQESLSIESVKDIRDRDLNNIRTFSIFLIFPIIFSSILLGLVATNRFLLPLHKLNEEISKINSENLGIKIPKNSNDEIGKLIDSFNDMSGKLYKSFNLQKEFIQDASHELQTPLTVVRLKVDTISHDDNATIEDYKKVNSDILGTLKTTSNLTDDLFLLTTTNQNNNELINIQELIDSQLAKLQPLIEAKKIRVSKSYPNQLITLKGNTNNLGRAIYNLIQNAIKYGNNIILIRLNKIKSQVLLEIEDNGDGISQDDIERIFQRFYRVDKSRSRKTGGVGLGLAIVKKIIEEHSGEITVSSIKGKTIFKIKFVNYGY